jgi:hypothetical protein
LVEVGENAVVAAVADHAVRQHDLGVSERLSERMLHRLEASIAFAAEQAPASLGLSHARGERLGRSTPLLASSLLHPCTVDPARLRLCSLPAVHLLFKRTDATDTARRRRMRRAVRALASADCEALNALRSFASHEHVDVLTTDGSTPDRVVLGIDMERGGYPAVQRRAHRPHRRLMSGAAGNTPSSS